MNKFLITIVNTLTEEEFTVYTTEIEMKRIVGTMPERFLLKQCVNLGPVIEGKEYIETLTQLGDMEFGNQGGGN